jgi:hypothetical protein
VNAVGVGAGVMLVTAAVVAPVVAAGPGVVAAAGRQGPRCFCCGCATVVAGLERAWIEAAAALV